ncbi:hypothetical protein OB919_05145 [Halobacteria archaeon AArc-curdl1]|uniref:Uncharacterized protein n=1 Tax=Natronosalvus hydrolyticus TaxID=2979988 RepID=A0AAP2Z690_9EURY|nr:hypothetical protein [Halobacteria archaeon AArc-curdl1]
MDSPATSTLITRVDKRDRSAEETTVEANANTDKTIVAVHETLETIDPEC